MRRIVWHVAILCQSDARIRTQKRQFSDVFDVFDGFQIMAEVTILLRAHVRARTHRLAAHRAAGTTGGDDRGRFRAQVPRLLTCHAACKRGVILFRTVQIVRDDDNSVLIVIVAQLHAADPKLLARLQVELGKTWRRRKHRSGVRQAGKHLFERQSQGLDLLLLHPDRVCLAVDDRQEPETAVARFADRFDLNPLRVEISTHSFEPPGYGGKPRPAPVTWNWRGRA